MVRAPISSRVLPPGLTFLDCLYNKLPNLQTAFESHFHPAVVFCVYEMRPTRDLAQTALFTQQSENLSVTDRTRLSYERAKAIGKAYGSCPGCYHLPSLTHEVAS
jgi:hypothetical protein